MACKVYYMCHKFFEMLAKKTLFFNHIQLKETIKERFKPLEIYFMYDNG